MNIQFLKGRQTSRDYIELLKKSKIDSEGKRLCGDNWLFQQDNAPIHKAKIALDFFKNENINLLDHPPLSPDLNPIENLWGWMAREVYKNGSFNTKSELKFAIIKAWASIPESLIRNLISSMPNRIFELILKGGSATHY